jgi:hypothetical protein
VRSFARTWTTDLKDRRIRRERREPRLDRHAGTRRLIASSETGQQRLKALSKHGAARTARHARRKSRRRWCSWRPTTAAISPGSNCSWMVDWRKCRLRAYRPRRVVRMKAPTEKDLR